MSHQLPPDLVAKLDQRQAALRQLVGYKLHHDQACDLDRCPGFAVGEVIASASRGPLEELAAIAVCELARLGYAEPLDPSIH